MRTTDFVYQKAIRALNQFETITSAELAKIVQTILKLP